LQNTIERAAILSAGPTLEVDWELGPQALPTEQKPVATPASHQHNGEAAAVPPPGEQSLESIERTHILGILRQTRGVIEGPRGAAKLLDMKPSTVRFRMKKLGISKVEYLA